MRTQMRIFIVAVGLLMWQAAAYAQGTGTGEVRGIVTDKATGEPVIGATVVATSPALQGQQAAITDETGQYFITNLPPGTYQLAVYYAEAQFSRTNVLIQLGKQAQVNIDISSEAAAGETIVIEGRAPLIDQGSTKTGTTITNDYTENIPTGRTFGSVIGAAAGSEGDLYGTSISGSTSAENIYIVEGINTTDPGFGLLSTNLPNEFIRETEVITGGYNAEYGRSTGGIVNVITKSGSNEFHGSVFGYWSPGALTAAQKEIPSSSSAIAFEENLANTFDFGAEIGGPIIQDRLWFHVGLAPSLSSYDITRTINTLVDENNDGLPDQDENGFNILREIDSIEYDGESNQTYYYTAKISGAVSPEHQGSISLLGSPRVRDYVGTLAGEETVNQLDLSDNILDTSLKWTSKFFDNQTQVDLVVGHHYDSHSQSASTARGEGSQIRYETGRPLADFAMYEPSAVPAGCIDGGADDPFPMITNCPVDVYRIGGVGFLEDTTSTRTSAILSATQRVKALGHHVFKAGLEYEGQGFDDNRGYSGDGFLRDFGGLWYRYRMYTPVGANPPAGAELIECGGVDVDGDGVFEVEPGSCARNDILEVSSNTRNLAAYIQDSWSILPNLTVNAGLRAEHQQLYNAEEVQDAISPITGEVIGEEAFSLSMLAPRVGVIYDWTQEGRSKLYGHYGRFYESIPMDINSRAFGGEALTIHRFVGDEACAGPPDSNPTPMCDDAALFDYIPLGSGQTEVAPGIGQQYLDELILGGEYEVIPDLKVGAAYIYRDLGRVIEDISTDGGTTYVIANPGEADFDEIASMRAQADALEATDPAAAKLMRWRADLFAAAATFDDPKRSYHGVQLTANRRFTDSFFVQASYTISKLKGNYPGLFSPETGQLDPNLTSMYDLPDLMANRYGDLAADAPHNFKLDGFYRLDLQNVGLFTFGGRFRATSGRPINTLGQHELYGRQESYILPRGTAGRTDFVTRIDTHIAYGRRLSEDVVLEAFVDIFNLFNQQPGTSADEEYTLDVVNPIVGGDEEDLEHAKVIGGGGQVATQRDNYGNISARQAPFNVRFGMRLTF